MKTWIVRCATCNHVCRDSDWVPVKTDKPLVSKLTCPKCGGESYYKATPAEIAAAKGKSKT